MTAKEPQEMPKVRLGQINLKLHQHLQRRVLIMIEDNEELEAPAESEFQQILSSSERKCIEHLGSVYYAITSEGVEI